MSAQERAARTNTQARVNTNVAVAGHGVPPVAPRDPNAVVLELDNGAKVQRAEVSDPTQMGCVLKKMQEHAGGPAQVASPAPAPA